MENYSFSLVGTAGVFILVYNIWPFYVTLEENCVALHGKFFNDSSCKQE